MKNLLVALFVLVAISASAFAADVAQSGKFTANVYCEASLTDATDISVNAVVGQTIADLGTLTFVINGPKQKYSYTASVTPDAGWTADVTTATPTWGGSLGDPSGTPVVLNPDGGMNCANSIGTITYNVTNFKSTASGVKTLTVAVTLVPSF